MLILIWIMICRVHNNYLKCYVLVYIAIVIEMFCAYLELDMDIDVVIYCVELVAIVFKFCTCKLLDMDNGVDYDI